MKSSGDWDVNDYTIPGDVRAIEVLNFGRVSRKKEPISLKCAEQNVESVKDQLHVPPWQFKLVAAFIGYLRNKMTKVDSNMTTFS